MSMLPKEWKTQTLVSLCDDGKQDIVDGPFGSNLKRSDYRESGVPVLKIQNIGANLITLKKMDFVSDEKYEQLRRHSYEPGDIIMTKLGDPLGVSAIVGDIPSGLIVADLVRIRPSKIDTKFLCHQLNSPSIQSAINGQQKGTTRPRVNITMVRELPVSVPPLPEQLRIVENLEEQFSRLDAAAASIRAVRQKAEQFRRSLLQAAFTGGFFEQGDDEWDHSKLGEVATLLNGRAYKKDELLTEGKYRVLRVGNFFSNPNWYWSDLELDDNKYCSSGDLLYAWSASFGPRIWTGEKVIFHYHIWKVLEDSDRVRKRWLKYWFDFDVLRVKQASGTGSIMLHVTKRDMEQREIFVPPLAQQQHIVEVVEEQFSRLDAVLATADEAENRLNSLRRSILHAAFSGTLTAEWRATHG